MKEKGKRGRIKANRGAKPCRLPRKPAPPRYPEPLENRLAFGPEKPRGPKGGKPEQKIVAIKLVVLSEARGQLQLVQKKSARNCLT